ncbi:MAG: AHH domain-containing protein [Nannocystaceae bacterium]
MTEKHKNFVKQHEEHDKDGAGCIVYCTSDYDEGNPHSHRYNAAEQARGEGRVPYSSYCHSPFEVGTWSLSKLNQFKNQGGLASAITYSGTQPVASVKPYAVEFHPFPHQGHHIIPSENLEIALTKVMKVAGSRAAEVQNFVVGAILKEPYNNNDKPNMIVLPTQLQDSQVLGLPKHLGSHPNYSKMVYGKVVRKFNKAYKGVAKAIKNMEHVEDQDVPPIKPDMLSISVGMYEAVITTAVAKRSAGRTLNEVSDVLKKCYKPAVIG